jgi:hypothetical protein
VQADPVPELAQALDRVRALGRFQVVEDALAHQEVGRGRAELALQLGERVPDELVTPRFQRPVAIRFLTAKPGPLPTGVVREVGQLERARAFPGVERVDTWIEPGETIRPVQTAGDRRGYVIAEGGTNLEALERADAAASLIDVLTA